jgi:hypothetical protein
MTMEDAFTRLPAEFHRLGESLAAARITIVEDHPLADDSVLVDVFRDPVEDLIGRTGETLNLALEARQAIESGMDADQIRRLLIACHHKHNEISDLYHSELAPYARMASLVSFGRRRGGEWLHWSRCVRDDLERCRPVIDAIDRALLECWQELSAPAGKITIGRC